MASNDVVRTFLFVLCMCLITMLPFVIVIGGVLVLKSMMSPKAPGEHVRATSPSARRSRNPLS